MKTFMFLLALVCGLCMHSQHRMYEEGKSWRVNDYYFTNEGRTAYEYEYSVVGDTLINDTLATMVRSEFLNTHSYTYTYVYEEDSKVYVYCRGTFQLEYDFNWEVGSTLINDIGKLLPLSMM